jgi:hypothetical protein
MLAEQQSSWFNPSLSLADRQNLLIIGISRGLPGNGVAPMGTACNAGLPNVFPESGITRPWCSTARQLRKFTQKRVKEFPIVASDRCYAVTQYLIQKPADRSTAEFVQLFDSTLGKATRNTCEVLE